MTPTPLPGQARALPLPGSEGRLLSGRDSTLTRKRREPGQRVLGRGDGGSRLQGKHGGGLPSRPSEGAPLRWAAFPSGRAELREPGRCPAETPSPDNALALPASAPGKTLIFLPRPWLPGCSPGPRLSWNPHPCHPLTPPRTPIPDLRPLSFLRPDASLVCWYLGFATPGPRPPGNSSAPGPLPLAPL